MTTTPSVATTPEMQNEQVLLEGLLENDPSAWREFNKRYSRLIHSCIAKVLNRFSSVATQDDALEVYSTLCLQLLARDKHKLRSFDISRGNKLGTWLGMLATHATYDLLRRKRRTPHTEELDAASPVKMDASSADEICAAREQAQRVALALSTFSEKDQQFFRLYFGEGLEPDQVACAMGINVKTVYSKKHKIRSRLEALLGQAQMAA